MKTEEIIFTEEMFKLLFNRVYEICKAKNKRLIDYVRLDDGCIQGVEEYYGRAEDTNYYNITVDEINNLDLDALIAERIEVERIKKEKEAAERIEIERLNKIRQEEEEFLYYQKLKAKFEGK